MTQSMMLERRLPCGAERSVQKMDCKLADCRGMRRKNFSLAGNCQLPSRLTLREPRSRKHRWAVEMSSILKLLSMVIVRIVT